MFYKKNVHMVLSFLAGCLFSYVCRGAELEFQRVPSDDVPKKLAELAKVTRENYEKIKTWQGKMNWHSVYVYRGADKTKYELKQKAGVELSQWPEQVEKISNAKIEFGIDLTKNLYFKLFDRESPLLVDPASEESYPISSGQLERKKVITSDYQIDVYPDRRKKDGTVSGRKAVKQSAKSYREQSDPRGFFDLGTPVWELLSQLSQALKNLSVPKEMMYKVVIGEETKDNNILYHIEITAPGDDLPFMKFTLESNAGFNPTYAEQRRNSKGFVLTKTTTSFVKIQGVFLPKTVSILNFDSVDGKLRRTVEYDITEAQINAAIPEDTFSVQKCGLFDGDHFIDEIAKKEYMYKLDSGCFVGTNDGKKYKHTVTGGFVGMTE